LAEAPFGHWKTTTFLAALRRDGLAAPMVLDGPMTGQAFLAYVEQVLIRKHSAKDAGSAVALDIDDVDACLRLGVRTRVPGAIAELDALDLRQKKAAPFAAWRQAGSALAGKLVGQRRLLPVLVAEDLRA
jgi:hypothetical protein